LGEFDFLYFAVLGNYLLVAGSGVEDPDMVVRNEYIMSEALASALLVGGGLAVHVSGAGLGGYWRRLRGWFGVNFATWLGLEYRGRVYEAIYDVLEQFSSEIKGALGAGAGNYNTLTEHVKNFVRLRFSAPSLHRAIIEYMARRGRLSTVLERDEAIRETLWKTDGSGRRVLDYIVSDIAGRLLTRRISEYTYWLVRDPLTFPYDLFDVAGRVRYVPVSWRAGPALYR